MAVVYGLDKVTPEAQGGAVAVGVFDGVHWGHRAIFEQSVRLAHSLGIPAVALTFEKHPAELLAPDRAPQYITTLDQRIELIQLLGVDQVVVAQFDHALASLTSAEFVDNVLVERLQARRIVVGSNFRFGKGRTGDIRYLSARGPEIGIEVAVVSSVIVDDGPASSTRIRALIGRGDVEDAAKLLGRRFALRGTVVSGRRVGRTMGFPTANLEVAPRQLVPGRGVYAVEAPVGSSVYSGVCNIGTRPTFAGKESTIEVHLMGFDGDLYGRRIDVTFCRRLRDEMTFESPERLAEQIRLDMERAACGGGSRKRPGSKTASAHDS